jgi:hypothetical protein
VHNEDAFAGRAQTFSSSLDGTGLVWVVGIEYYSGPGWSVVGAGLLILATPTLSRELVPFRTQGTWDGFVHCSARLLTGQAVSFLS